MRERKIRYYLNSLHNEEFQKVQSQIKSILKLQEYSFGILSMGATSIGRIIIFFSSLEMAIKAEEVPQDGGEGWGGEGWGGGGEGE